MVLPPEAEYNRSEYKRDTKYIAGYLLKASRKCGFVPTPSNNNSYNHEICECDFEPMAQCIVDNPQKTSIPSFIRTILVRAIRFRREVTAWYRLKSCDTNADQQHDAFSSRLQRTLDILRPHIPKPDNEKTNGKTASSTTTALELGFSKLALQDTSEDDEESIEQPVIVEDLPSVPAVDISLDEANVEENFFLDIKSFVRDMQSIRKYVLDRWTGKSDLMTKAFVTNTAIAIVRQKEYEFDQSLSRPPQYPAKDFPVWCLPALLLLRELYPEKLGDKIGLKRFIEPSDMVGTSGAKSRLCFYPVYNGLKLLLNTIQWAPRSQHLAAFLVHNLREEHQDRDIHPHVFGARDMASVLYVLNQVSLNLHNIPEDELTRGIRYMDKEDAIPFWLTFAMQIQLEINDLPKDSVGNPLEDLRREVTTASILVQEIKTHPNSLVDVHRGKDFDSLEGLILDLKTGFFDDQITLLLQGVLFLLCSDILRDILDMFRSDPVFENDFLKEQNKPTLSLTIVLRILTLAANEIKLRKRQPNLPAKRMDQLREVFNIMQKHYMRPMETTPDEKTWAGDVCIADLVNTEKEPQIGEYWSAANFFSGRDIFAHGGRRIDPNNLGPAAAENLYKNWDFGGSKEESRMFNALSRFHAGRGERAIVSRALEGRYG
ncbi:uncharacterized protein J4E79_007024 [Alternaria viburni]|uniref:uncharacterized protein n=1 Tax=Alternaria viburni TaxID=566460 RepID=UPI0020C5712D|nr:uncharacterized protein J4E79_007024 [Alternaria viburni]KAI4658618.1 hypothetical protein J4E79_007024 [Alternaria viburni]